MKIDIDVDEENRKDNIKIERKDIIDAYSTLAAVIYPILKKFKEEKESWPTIETFDPCDFDYNINDPEKAWDEILDKIIFAFYELQRDWDYDYYFDGIVDESGYKVHTPSNHLVNMKTFSIDEKGMKENKRKIHEGLYLFSKYYTNLWS